MNPFSQKESQGLRDALAQADHPLLMKELAQRLKSPKSDQREFKRLLRKMVRTGEVVRVGGNRYGLPDKMDLAIGRFKGHREGYGFVILDDGGGRDIYIGAKHVNEAMHGDRVGVRIEETSAEGKREGRIIRVLERARKQIVGRFERDRDYGFVVPSDNRIVQDLLIAPGNSGDAKPNDIVLAEILIYPSKRRNPEGKIIKVLGDTTALEIDTEIVIHSHALRERFPEDVAEAAKRVEDQISGETLKGRIDLRSLPTVTIDGEHARDFDDAVSIEKTPDGTRLWVHIADVAHYVSEGSALDVEALLRGTSIYFPDKVLPMFPERLSNGICSLKPNEDRLCLTAEIEFDPQGIQRAYKLYESVIQSNERMTYTDVWKIISRSDEAVRTRYAALLPQFDDMERLAKQLHQGRLLRGGLDFDLPEPEIIIGPGGETLDIVQGQRNFAHQLIEEFMLAANETVARHLTALHIPTLYRIHEPPSPERIEAFNELIALCGLAQHKIGQQVDSKALSKILESVKGHREEPLINQVLLRSMRQARYSEDNLGHFGLASEAYTHFTSPIRRYPDLTVHRLLKKTLQAKMSNEEKEAWQGKLPDIARQCSERERIAVEAEREVVQRKKVKFMADKVGAAYTGLITGVTSFGLFVLLEAVYVEGLVHVSSLNDDYYLLDEKTHALVGRSRKRSFRLGQTVDVVVAQADVEKWQVDLKIVHRKKRREKKS